MVKYFFSYSAILVFTLPAHPVAGEPVQTSIPGVMSSLPDPGERMWWSNVRTQIRLQVSRTGEVLSCTVISPDYMADHSHSACARIEPTSAFVESIAKAGKSSDTTDAFVDLRIKVALSPKPDEDVYEHVRNRDFRLARSPQVKCVIKRYAMFIDNRGDATDRFAADRYSAIPRRQLLDEYAIAYNKIMIANGSYPFRDVCTIDQTAPVEPKALIAYLSKSVVPDDGTLSAAVRRGNLPLAASRATSKPELIWQRDIFGATPLDWAIMQGRPEIAKALLGVASGADGSQDTGNWRTSAFLAAISLARTDILDWVLGEVKPNPKRVIALHGRLDPAAIERLVGYEAARKISNYWLAHPDGDARDLLLPARSDDARLDIEPRITAYVVSHDAVVRQCREEQGGWRRGCELLKFIAISAGPNASKAVLDTFNPDPSQMAGLITATIEQGDDRNLGQMLARKFDRETVRSWLSVHRTGQSFGSPEVTTVPVPEYFLDTPPETPSEKNERVTQERREKALRDAEKARSRQAIERLLFRAGFTQKEISG